MKDFKQRDHESENGPTRLGPSGTKKPLIEWLNF